jgi:Xaa-Pro aminopeptidase
LSLLVDHNLRLERLKSVMEVNGVDAVLLSVGADLPYFTGYEAMATERVTMLVVTVSGEPTLFIPALEAPRVDANGLNIRPWHETEDPLGIISDRLAKAPTLAVGDQTWSVFTVGLQERLPGSKWLAASALTGPIRMIKDESEIEALRQSALGVDRCMARVPTEVGFEGRTEREISRDLDRMTVEEGHDVAAFAIVASGPNAASPHHEPGGRVVQHGDLVVCDFGGRRAGYFSDSTRTFVVGEASRRQIEVHDTVLAANRAAREAVAPGVACQDVDRAARTVISDAGFGDEFVHRTGHGIGLEVHEHPYIVEGNGLLLQPGMAFSIEPGIYIEGELGVRIEDIVVCGSEGVDELNRAPRELVEVS